MTRLPTLLPLVASLSLTTGSCAGPRGISTIDRNLKAELLVIQGRVKDRREIINVPFSIALPDILLMATQGRRYALGSPIADNINHIGTDKSANGATVIQRGSYHCKINIDQVPDSFLFQVCEGDAIIDRDVIFPSVDASSSSAHCYSGILTDLQRMGLQSRDVTASFNNMSSSHFPRYRKVYLVESKASILALIHLSPPPISTNCVEALYVYSRRDR